MRLEIDIPEHQYNNIMTLDSMSLGRAPYKGIIMYAINAIKQGKVLEQEPKWIPVSERLPEERHGVLVLCPTRKNIYCACYEEKQWWIFGAYREKVTEEIVAWMPLPKAYREVEE